MQFLGKGLWYTLYKCFFVSLLKRGLLQKDIFFYRSKPLFRRVLVSKQQITDLSPLSPLILSFITKTYLYYFDPLKPHFYIVKLGFTGVYIMFLISAKNIDCEYSLEPPLMSTRNLCFDRNMKNIRIFI